MLLACDPSAGRLVRKGREAKKEREREREAFTYSIIGIASISYPLFSRSEVGGGEERSFVRRFGRAARNVRLARLFSADARARDAGTGGDARPGSRVRFLFNLMGEG